jgi:hypothetical protein
MSEQMTQQMMATAERLASAAEALDRVLQRLDAQQEALNAKVDRIAAAVEEGTPDPRSKSPWTISRHAADCGIASRNLRRRTLI